MKRILSVLSLVFAVTLSAVAQPSASVRLSPRDSAGLPVYSTSQLKRLARTAHTAQQYTELADQFALRRRAFSLKAADAMHLWASRSAMINPLSEKWPRPVDSARNLYDYYQWEADHAEAMQGKFDRLADDAVKQ